MGSGQATKCESTVRHGAAAHQRGRADRPSDRGRQRIVLQTEGGSYVERARLWTRSLTASAALNERGYNRGKD